VIDPRAFLSERIGLRLDASTRSRLDHAVAQGAAGADDATYARRLTGDPAAAQALVDRVTVQESSFFRHPEHFALLARELPALGGGGVIWSAGCGNGQEPWSLAIMLEEAGLPGWRVVASDVSHAALERARLGVYSERELRGVALEHKHGFFDPVDGDRWRVGARLRPRVRFVDHNLVDAQPPHEARLATVVLCRNVLIYLRSEVVARLMGTLSAHLPADGLLLIGTSESLPHDLPGFRAERLGSVFVHRPRPAAAPAPEPSPSPPESRLPEVPDLLVEGERLAARGQRDAAAVVFRKALYLDPDHPLARLRLDHLVGEEGR
jgi:chemotaxis protein methyltransferase CheR